MAKRKLQTYQIDFHHRGHKRSTGRAFISATTAKFAENVLRRREPMVVIDKTKPRKDLPVIPKG